MFTNVLTSTFIGFLAGVGGTFLGGLLGHFFKSPSKRTLSILLSFSSGIMISIVFFELIPQALSGGIITTLSGFSLGIAFTLLLSKIEVSHFSKAGFVTAVAIAAHNFPEGLAIGASNATSLTLGLLIALTLALHNIPEGLALLVSLKSGKVSSKLALLCTALAGLPMAAGAFLGSMVTNISASFLSVCLSFAAGAMLYITIDDLLPQAYENFRGVPATISFVLGTLIGFLICFH